MLAETVPCPHCDTPLHVTPEELAQPQLHCPRCGVDFPNRWTAEPADALPSLHCPHCNAIHPATALEMTQAKIVCPTCGEAFVNPHFTGQADDAGRETALPEPELGRWSNRAIARILIAVMLLSATVGLIYMLLTVDFRRNNDNYHPLPEAPPHPLTAAEDEQPTSPRNLIGLEYLPRDCFVVGGLHVHSLYETAEGKALLLHLKQPGFDLGLNQVRQWTGLKLVDLDHLALGIRTREQIPEMFLVVRTRRRYSRAEVAKVVAPAKPDNWQGRPVYRVKSGLTGGTQLWLVDPQTIVVHTSILIPHLEDLEAIRVKRSRTAAFSVSITRIIQKHLSQEALLWAVGDLTQNEALKELLKLTAPNRKQSPLLDQIQMFSLGLRLQKGITIAADIQGTDAEAVQHIESWLKKHPPRDAEIKVVAAPPVAATKNAEDAHWVQAQVRLPLEPALEWLEQLPEQSLRE